MDTDMWSEIVLGLVLLAAIGAFPINKYIEHRLENEMPEEQKDWKTILDENRVEILFWVFLFGTVLAIFN